MFCEKFWKFPFSLASRYWFFHGIYFKASSSYSLNYYNFVCRKPTVSASSSCIWLGPNKHGLVTLSWLNGGWAFKTDVCWRLDNVYLRYFSANLCIFFKKQWFNISSLGLYCYIYWKFVRLYEHQQETYVHVPFLAILGVFSRKSSDINIKKW